MIYISKMSTYNIRSKIRVLVTVRTYFWTDWNILFHRVYFSRFGSILCRTYKEYYNIKLSIITYFIISKSSKPFLCEHHIRFFHELFSLHAASCLGVKISNVVLLFALYTEAGLYMIFIALHISFNMWILRLESVLFPITYHMEWSFGGK